MRMQTAQGARLIAIAFFVAEIEAMVCGQTSATTSALTL